MNLPATNPASRAPAGRTQKGSVMIMVLWIVFGLVTITLYFAHEMGFQLRAADNRTEGIKAELALEGAARYVASLLANTNHGARLPELQTYDQEAVKLGDATFWFIGRGEQKSGQQDPTFGLVDEASKLNLNTATPGMLELLPGMTAELAAAIVDWRDTNDVVSTGGAETETYLRLRPAYRCKDAPFESTEELRLVAGFTLDLLLGEDTNLNGTLDPNENDADLSLPHDNKNGRLDPGILDFVTTYTREPNTRADGTPRLLISSTNAPFLTLLTNQLGAQKAVQVRNSLIGIPGGLRSLLQFYDRSQLTAEEFAKISDDITVTNAPFLPGLVNVNTAREEVLTCIPGIGPEKAASLVAFRLSNPDRLTSLAWVKDLLERTNLVSAGPYLTARSYQFTADIAAVGHYGRGYRRTRFVFDATEDTPKIIHRQDLSQLGWALGANARNTSLLMKDIR